MAILESGSVKHFKGLSSDTKPTDASIGAGSTLVETDTGIEYFYDGDSWRPKASGDYKYDISRGKVTGAKPFYGYGRITTGAAVDTPSLIWPNGAWSAPPSTGVQISVVSTNANDTVAGTGARVLRVIYLDTSLSEQYEDINMNGTTTVLSVATNIRFIQCTFVLEFGSGVYAAGNISLSNGSGSNYSYIEAGAIRCSSSARMVPAGKRLIITQAIGSSLSPNSPAATNIQIATSKFEGVDYSANSVLIPFGDLGFQDNSFGIEFIVPAKFDEGTIIGMLATTDKSAIISGSWYGFIEDAI